MDDLTVQTKCGTLKGRIRKAPGGFEYESFCGIPYAKPPVGKFRFKDPVPFGSWSGTWDATEEGSVAPQYDIFDPKALSGSDDCLFVNVHRPKNQRSKSSLAPVMVEIHGGGFVMGSGSVDRFGPEYLVERGAVVAAMNYRLGVLGFLCTDARNARGDMGLKDQSVALAWIKDNVASFGGDPDNITIFGVSAGGASVEYHLLSPTSAGLFHRAIVQSGSVFNPWARIRDPFKQARSLARRLGYEADGSDDQLFEFLDGFSSIELVRASAELIDNDDLKQGLYLAFVPAINVFKDGKGFINEEPADILREGRHNRVPCVAGFCDKEGIFMLHFYRFEEPKRDLEKRKFRDYVPEYLNKNFRGGAERMSEIYRKRPDDRNKNEDQIDFVSDVSINAGMFYALHGRLNACEGLNQYFYNFTFEGNLLPYKFKNDIGENYLGTSHADEMGYLSSRANMEGQTPEPKDLIMKDQMVDLWFNFAKNGNPTPDGSKVKWLPVSKNEFRFMELDVDLKMKSELKDERRELWSEIYRDF